MKRFALIVAGGKGSRMQSALPKQFMPLRDVPVLIHTISQFVHAYEKMEIIVVLPSDQIATWSQLCKQLEFDIEHTIVEGGDSRYASVRNGLKFCGNDGIVAIHDGVRPLVSTELIIRCIKSAEDFGSGIPAIPVTQSLRKVNSDINQAMSREGVYEVQTPQCFQLENLQGCYSSGDDGGFTDDATVYEANGYKINLVDGESTNIKITTATDLKIAEAILGMSQG